LVYIFTLHHNIINLSF